MTKKELGRKVNLNIGIDEDIINRVIDATFDEIGNAVADHETVLIINFGVFEPRLHTGKNARNPRTGGIVETEPFTRMWFRSARVLKDKVKAGKG